MAHPTGTRTRKITIQDVAKRAGVSAMTVSRALNKNSQVAAPTRAKILRAARTLDYRPNMLARGLASQRSYVLGMFFANPSANYVSELLVGALSQCRNEGYHLVIERSGSTAPRWGSELENFVTESRADGVIVPPPLCDAPRVLAAVRAIEVPVVRIAPSTQLQATPSVWMDDRAAAAEMTEHLIGLGHRRIGFIKGHPDVGSSEQRYQGFQQALREGGIPEAVPRDVEQGYFTYRSGLECAQRLLAAADRPTAIFACNDDMAAGALSAARAAGLRIPEDISIAGFDDTQIATTVWPALTTIRQPIAEMAAEAVRALVAAKRGERGEAVQRRVRFKLIARESTGRAAR